MPRVSLCLLAGMLVPQLSSFPRLSDLFGGEFVLAGFLGLALLASAILVRLSSRRQRSGLCWFAAGMLLFCASVEQAAQSRLEAHLAGDSMVTTLRIVDFPRPGPAGTAFAAEPVGDPRIPAKLRLAWYDAPVSLRLGDVWQMELRLKPPHGGQNPGSPDYEAWLLRERVGATGYVVTGSRNRLLDSGQAGFLDRLRAHFVERVTRVVTSPEAAAVLAALVVGTRHLLDDGQWDRFGATGTSHLMAISGLHIGLAAAGAFAVLATIAGLAGGQRNDRDAALFGAVLVAGLYAAVSGFAVPARRAFVMLALTAATVLCRRQARMARVLGAACIVVLCIDPLDVLAPGFLLSYAAVAVLLWAARRSSRVAPGAWHRATRATRILFDVQIALLLGLAPLTVLLFDRISLAAPAVNLVAVPVFSLVTVPFALSGFVLDGPFAPIGDLLLRASARSVGAIDTLLVRVAATPAASRPVAGLEGAAALYLLAPVAWVLLPAYWPGRWLACLGLVGLLAHRPPAPAHGCVELTVLDVGQGLAIAGRTARHAFVYDTGPAYLGGGTAAERVLVPFLEHAGIRRIDRAIVSHSDLDHAGGLAVLEARVPLRHIVSGDALALPGRAVGRCIAGHAWHWDGISFRYLHPPDAGSAAPNDASCVLLIEAGESRVLLAGDIEAAVETRLVQARVLPTVDVTTVPHHGSSTSSTIPYVRSVLPAYALVSAARYNQWGFPKSDIVERWRNVGATVLNTADSGAIEVRVCAGQPEPEVRTWRSVNRRLWHTGHGQSGAAYRKLSRTAG